MSPAADGRGRARWPGGVLLAALSLYSLAVYYGVGVPAEGIAVHWYEPRGFLHHQAWAAPGLDGLQALLWVGLPAALLAGACILASPSALARTLALGLMAACLLFAFYGAVAPGVWQFFGWRGSAVLWLVALCLGVALAAPLLADAWLRLGWPLRLAWALPPALAAIAFLRNSTGTDPALPFSLSPWPAVPVFGLETGALLAAVCWSGAALGAGALALARARRARALAVAGLALGLALPAALLLGAGALDLVPFRVDARTLGPAVGAAALAIVGAAGSVRGSAALGARARRMAVGAALVGAPLLAGQALARWDYHLTRERDAGRLIAALERYYAREQIYPDALEELVKAGDLERLPTPSIGFALLSDSDFRYESFGTDFLLEFQAPRWVECAYSPPFEMEEEDEPDVAAASERGGLGEAWSCPSEPPELW